MVSISTLIVLAGDEWGGGEDRPTDEKFSEKCPCSHNNNTALIKQISLCDTALVMDKDLKFQFK